MSFSFSSIDKNPLVSKYEQYKFLGIKKYYSIEEFSNIIDYYYYSQDIEKAREVVSDALVSHPSSFDLLLRKARILIEDKKFKEVIKLLKYLKREEPQETELYLLLGFSYASINRTKLAEKSFNRLLELAEDKMEYISFLNDIAYIYFSLELYSLAYKYYKKAYKLDPKDKNLLYEMAFCLEKENFNTDSINLYLKYLKHNPFHVLAWYNLGVVYLKINNREKALEAFNFALAIDSKFTSAIYNKAYVLFENKKYKDSLICYKKLLNLEKNNPSAFFFIAKNLIELKQYHKALKFLKKTLDIVPKFPQAWFEIANLFYINNKFKESRIYILKALKLGDLNTDYIKLLGKTYLKEKNYKLAAKAFKWAIENNPYDEELWINYSEVYENEGNLKKAIDILNNSKQYLKNNKRVFEKLKSLSYKSNIQKHTK